ncbi:MAG: glycosyltransferase family 2 protein [Thermodesulfobacteriota bacterium]
MKKAIIIPIYLRLREPQELHEAEGLTLARRAIESLKILEDQDFTLILPVCFDLTGGDDDVLFPEMDGLLREELRNTGLQRALVFSSLNLEPFRKYLESRDFKNFNLLVDLKGFPKIRNTGLLLCQGLSIDVAIFIDNDEVIEEPGFLKVACEYLNETWKGEVVHGKGGFYINPDGTILLPDQPLWWRFSWNKIKWMNRVWKKLLSSEERFVPSPILLGGNLVLHRNLFRSVPFDPYIPRGEDTDYLINASRLGFRLLFDKELRIKHLHPERTEDYFYQELKGDMERFLYEREKASMSSDIDLDPYPGYFLRWTLYPKTMFTSLLLSFDYLGKGEWKRARECLANMGLIFQERSDVWPRYLRFREAWVRVMGEIEKEGMNEILGSCWI